MSSAQAILFGAMIVAGSFLFLNHSNDARAYSGGPYAIARHSNPTASAGVFRLDTATGEMSYCYITSQNQADVVCSKPVR